MDQTNASAVPKATATAIINRKKYQTVVTSGKHALIADEPESAEGTDTGMAPFELLLSSLSSCTAITLQMYINRKMWIVDEIKVVQELYLTDNKTHIKTAINFKGELTDDQKKRLTIIADKCPVHKILTGDIKIDTVIL